MKVRKVNCINTTTAINTLCAYYYNRNSIDDTALEQARSVVYVAVAAACATDTEGLSDWLANGVYDDTDTITIQDIAREWDEFKP